MEHDWKDIPVIATLKEAAKWLRLCERTVWQMGKVGAIRVVRVGRSVRYCVREYMEKIHGVGIQ
jgi:hypothetical protein